MSEAVETELEEAIKANEVAKDALKASAELGLGPGVPEKPRRGRPPKAKEAVLIEPAPERPRQDYNAYMAGLYQLGYGFAGIDARIVYERDGFAVAYGTTPGIQHIPFGGADAGAIASVYAVATYPNGYMQFEWLPARSLADRIVDGEPVQDQLRKFAIAALLAKCPRT